MNKKLYLALVPVLVLVILGAINVYKNITWKEPTDGVTWGEKPNGLTALKVEVNSPAYLASIKKGDILYSINNIPIKTKIDLVKTLWIARDADQKVSYQIGREGEIITPSFYLQKKGVNLIYFYLALVGLTTLGHRPHRLLQFPPAPLAALTSISISCRLAFYAFYTFSPTGNLDFLDSVFYCHRQDRLPRLPAPSPPFLPDLPPAEEVPQAPALPPPLVYLPAAAPPGAEGPLSHVLAPAMDRRPGPPVPGPSRAPGPPPFHGLHPHHPGDRHPQLRGIPPSVFLKKQLKFIVSGLGMGIVPVHRSFTSCPFLAGRAPSTPAELTVLLQALIPLTFAYSISRYKLMDFEILLKKAVTLIVSFFVIALVYYVVSSQTRIFSENRLNAIILGVLAIILGATLFTPLKKLVQTLLDRAIYRRSYEYRKTLLFISKELSRERNLQNLSRSLLDSIANALSLRTIALSWPRTPSRLYVPAPPELGRGRRRPSIAHLRRSPSSSRCGESDYLSYYSSTDRKGGPEADRAFHPLRLLPFPAPAGSRRRSSAVWPWDGSRTAHTSRSEDWELLTTISPSVALALENAYLYSRESVRALEMQRLKDYSENIIESLTVGVAVIDQTGTIIGWNRVLEAQFGLKKADVLGRKLVGRPGSEELFGHLPDRHPAGLPACSDRDRPGPPRRSEEDLRHRQDPPPRQRR